MTTTVLPTRADWYADPYDPELIRFWDGQAWSHYTLLRPHGWDAAPQDRPIRWWQTWWAVVPALFFCAPLGLVGLWSRPGVANGLKAGVSVVALGLFAILIATSDGASEDMASAPTNQSPPSAVAQPAAAPTPAATPSPTPTPTPEVEVPDLKGLTRGEARRSLEAVGLVLDEIVRIPSGRPTGTVLRQSAKTGKRLVLGTAVTISLAAPLPKVPDVVGALQRDAARMVRAAGFVVRLSTETVTSGQNGAVLRVVPAVSAGAKPGSVVTMVVAKVVRPVAPPPTPVPAANCTAGYSPCLPPASDYDCAGGSGDGPAYASGPVRVTGSDPYRLDADGDGIACDS